MTGRSKDEYLSLSRVERDAFLEAAHRLRSGSPGSSGVLSGNDAVNHMKTQAGAG